MDQGKRLDRGRGQTEPVDMKSGKSLEQAVPGRRLLPQSGARIISRRIASGVGARGFVEPADRARTVRGPPRQPEDARKQFNKAAYVAAAMRGDQGALKKFRLPQ